MKKQKVEIPFEISTKGISEFIREWKKADCGADFKDKHKLNAQQWAKCLALAKMLRGQGVKLKVIKVQENWKTNLDFDILKKVAAE